ncbi:MAG: SulP family inorganic anion transporter [Deltaproteobacteria bacterium]|nr:SulP family inorganic anion transporter [Deltaproteobacteria bacterium]
MRPWLRTLLRPLAPPVRTLREYRLRDLPHDLIAGLTVSAVDLPQSMAFALIAGVPPIYGLYTAMVLALLGALFTSSRFLSVGPTNTQSLLVASIVAHVYGVHDMHYVYLVIALTGIKGVIQLAFAAARMGDLVRYVSRSVMLGFTAGAGVLILVEQFPSFLGVGVARAGHSLPGVLGAAQRLAPELGHVDLRSVGVGVATLVIVLGAKAIWRRAPGPLFAIVGAAVWVWAMGWVGTDMRLVPPMPHGLPHFELPRLGFGVAPQRIEWRELEALLGGALALAVLGMLESVAIAKSIAVRTGQRISANQEFFSQGFANLVGSFFLCMPGSGSFSRTALQYEAGARTRVASVFCAAFNALFFVLLAPLAHFIPLAALAAILFVVAVGLIDLRALARIGRTSRAELGVAGVTFLSALVVPLSYAIYVGIFLSLALYLRQASRLRAIEMLPTDSGVFVERALCDQSGASDILLLQLEGDLFFGVADELADRFAALVQAPVQAVVIRMKRTHVVDASVLAVFERFVRDMQERKCHVLICGLSPALLASFEAFGLTELLGPENLFETRRGIFESTTRALDRAQTLVGKPAPSAPPVALGTDDEGTDWAYDN